MANILALPSSSEDDALVNLADWVELSAFFSAKKSASKEDLRLQLERAPKTDDEDPNAHRMTEESAEAMAGDVFSELYDRASACLSETPDHPTYPFIVDEGKSIIRMTRPSGSSSDLVYLFLLAVSVSSMAAKDRKRAGKDPTKLFERLCADVLRSFWGGKTHHSDVMVFGTAATTAAQSRKFKANIEALCSNLGEGAGWKEDARAPGGGDGTLDLVAWRRFRDKREGALVGFAQCKTGVNWRDHITELSPSAFSRDYMQRPLVLEPIRIYMVPLRISRQRWVAVSGRAGIVVDRCRIVQYATSVEQSLLDDCKVWLDAIIAEQEAAVGAMKP